MNNLLNNNIFIAILLLFVLLSFLFNIWNFIKLKKLIATKKNLYRYVDTDNLEAIVTKCVDFMQETKNERNEIQQILEIIGLQAHLAIKKPNLLRYSSFENVGGNQSFSVCFLNEDHDGIILTCLHNRENNHIYLKQIDKGQPSHYLTDEEQQVLEMSLTENQNT